MKKKYLVTLKLSHFGKPKQVTIESEDLSHLSLKEKIIMIRPSIIDAVREQLRESIATRAEQESIEIETIEEIS